MMKHDNHVKNNKTAPTHSLAEIGVENATADDVESTNSSVNNIIEKGEEPLPVVNKGYKETYPDKS